MFGKEFKSELKEFSDLRKEASRMAEALGAKPVPKYKKINVEMPSGSGFRGHTRTGHIVNRQQTQPKQYQASQGPRVPFPYKPSFQHKGNFKKSGGKDFRNSQGPKYVFFKYNKYNSCKKCRNTRRQHCQCSKLVGINFSRQIRNNHETSNKFEVENFQYSSSENSRKIKISLRKLVKNNLGSGYSKKIFRG